MNKKQTIKILCVAVAMLLSASAARAQETEISAYFNGTLPVAQFNNAPTPSLTDPMTQAFRPMDRENIATGATAGLGVTLRAGVWFDMGFGELMPFAEGGFLWNNSKKSVRLTYDDNRAKYPAYFNIPLYIGFKYRYDINDIIRPFAEVGIGYDILFITRSYGVDDRWYKFKPSGALAWEAGLGTYLGQNVSLGLYYQGLGSHRIEYTKTSTDRNDGSVPDYVSRRTLGELTLRLGFHF